MTDENITLNRGEQQTESEATHVQRFDPPTTIVSNALQTEHTYENIVTVKYGVPRTSTVKLVSADGSTYTPTDRYFLSVGDDPKNRSLQQNPTGNEPWCSKTPRDKITDNEVKYRVNNLVTRYYAICLSKSQQTLFKKALRSKHPDFDIECVGALRNRRDIREYYQRAYDQPAKNQPSSFSIFKVKDNQGNMTDQIAIPKK